MRKKKSIYVLTPDRFRIAMRISTGSTIKDLKKELKKTKTEYNTSRMNFYFNSIKLSSDVLLSDINQPPGWSILATISNKFPEEGIYTFSANKEFKLTLKNSILVKEVKSLLLSRFSDYDGPIYLSVDGFPLPNLVPIGFVGLDENQLIIISSEDPLPDRIVTYTYQFPNKLISGFAIKANTPVKDLMSIFAPYTPTGKDNVKFLYHQRTLDSKCNVGDWGVTENDVIFVKVNGSRPKIKKKNMIKPKLGKNAQKFNRHFIPISVKSYSTQSVSLKLKNISNNFFLYPGSNSNHPSSNSISESISNYMGNLEPFGAFTFKLNNAVFNMNLPESTKLKDFLPIFEKMIGEKVIFLGNELSSKALNVFQLSKHHEKLNIFVFTCVNDHKDLVFLFDKSEIAVSEAINKISDFYNADPSYIQMIKDGNHLNPNVIINSLDIPVSFELQKVSINFMCDGESTAINFYKAPTVQDAKLAFCEKRRINISNISLSVDNLLENVNSTQTIDSDNQPLSNGTLLNVTFRDVYKVNVSIDKGPTELILFEEVPTIFLVKQKISQNMNILPISVYISVFNTELSDDFVLDNYVEILQIHIRKFVYHFNINNQLLDIAFDCHPTSDDAKNRICSLYSVEYESITLRDDNRIYNFCDPLPQDSILNIIFGPMKFQFEHENGYCFELEFNERPYVKDAIEIISKKIDTPPEMLILAKEEDDVLFPWEKLPSRTIISETDLKEGFFHFVLPRQRPFPIVLNEDAPIEVELPKIAERIGALPNDIKLVHDGRVLLPSETLMSLNLSPDDVITIFLQKSF